MREFPSSLPLKARPKRSLYLEDDPERGPVVVKRFHAPGTWQALWDHKRATREAKGLRRWHDAGLPVPGPATVRRRNGAWELVMPAIPGAQSLAEILSDRPLGVGQTAPIAAETGRLLAALDAQGHGTGDLHPGNLLFDEQGKAWLVDPTSAPVLSGRNRRDSSRWVRLCGHVREVSRPGFRRMVMRAYAKTSGATPPWDAAIGADNIEVEARSWRWREAQKREARWLRESGAVVPDPSGFQVREPCAGELKRASFETVASAKAVWLFAGRLQEMRIHAFRPERLDLSAGRPAIEFRMPPDAAPGAPIDPKKAGAWMGRWHDRGFAFSLGLLDHMWANPEGDWSLNPFDARTSALEHGGLEAPWTGPQQVADWMPWPLNSDGRRAFVHAFVREQSGPVSIRQEVMRRLLDA